MIYRRGVYGTRRYLMAYLQDIGESITIINLTTKQTFQKKQTFAF